MSSLLEAPLKSDHTVTKSKVMKIEWLGQTIASLCWICSMFIYGINSGGDWLQLIAGLSWLIANIANLNES